MQPDWMLTATFVWLNTKMHPVKIANSKSMFGITHKRNLMKGNYMNFTQAVINSDNMTTTTNGAAAYKSTCSKVLDFFSKAASMRSMDSTSLFKEAYQENPELALRALLWVRDVRGGAGERKVFRDNLKQLLLTGFDKYTLLDKVPEVGRWDDLLVAIGTKAEKYVLSLIKTALSNNNSLCAKWMPRKGTEAETLRKYLNLTPKQYRKYLVNLTQVVETQMCNNSWESIEYQKVPSNAHNIYKKAFSKHSPERYEAYKEALVKCVTKINASTLFPHQVVKSLSEDSTIANAQWKSLPNYIPDGSSVLPMIDLSGSMNTEAAKGFSCMDVAIALGLYTATKNTGVFKNLWLNFSAEPSLYQIKGESLLEHYNSLDFSNWGMNTDIEKAFKLILSVAVDNKVQPEDMPKTLMIFSDMQFDQATSRTQTTFENVNALFDVSGYQLPNIVFWNLNGMYKNTPCTKDKSGAMLVSGFSPSIMEAVLSDDLDQISPEGLMLKVLMKDRYDLS